jgi:hypothetical protein
MDTYVTLTGPQKAEGAIEKDAADGPTKRTVATRLAELEARIAELETNLQKEEDARMMQAMVGRLGLVVLHSDGPLCIPPRDRMPTCMICNERVKAGVWLYRMTARPLLDMSPSIEDRDGPRGDPCKNDISYYLHRDCFLGSIMDWNLHPDLNRVHLRLGDPRYRKPYPFDQKG